MVQSQKKIDFPPNDFYFRVYKRTNYAIDTIFISFDVFFNYAYHVKIKTFYSYFYSGKT